MLMKALEAFDAAGIIIGGATFSVFGWEVAIGYFSCTCQTEGEARKVLMEHGAVMITEPPELKS